MILRHVISQSILSMSLCVLLSGCFTGIESTPKITAKDVKRQGITASTDDKSPSAVIPQPLNEWEKGKQFYVVDDRIAMALEPKSTSDLTEGDIITFEKIVDIPSMTGETDTELYFLDKNGNTAIFRINTTSDELRKRSNVSIPFTIELSMVDDVKSALKGKHLFIRTPIWYEPDNDKSTNGLKFVEVEITDVQPGNQIYPAKIVFRPVEPMGTDEAAVYMAINTSVKSGRGFAALFDTDNPRNRYPTISDDMWKNIIHSRVAKFMTKEECRLALGSPSDVQQRNAISSIQEIWTYENGVYLIFEDGVLKSFRQ